MGWYPALLIASALLGAVCAGFILAQSPRERATQLAGLLVGAAAWWSLCEAQWNAAPDAAAAQVWMRLSAPGWRSWPRSCATAPGAGTSFRVHLPAA
jgi:hypothetical protein